MNCAICNKAFYRKDHLQKHLQTHNKLFIKGLNDGELLNLKQEPIEYDEKMSIPVQIPIEYNETEIIPDDSTSDDDIKMEIDESYTIPESIEVTVTKPKGGTGNSARPFACTLCEKTYKRRDHLKLHSLTHMKKENGCDECGKAFHSPELLLDHVGRVHGDDYSTGGGGEDSLLVPVHSIIGSQLGPEFVRHIPDANDLLVPRAPPDDRPHECQVCHRKFKRRQHLKVHANVHLKVEPTVWCSLCHAGFYHNQQFEDHQCPGLNPEITVEDPGRPGHAQRGNSKLDARKENNHPNDFIEVVEIEENIKIVDESRVDIQPEETNIPTPLRVFVCKYCSKPFKRKDHYRIHLHIHTGVKSFFCPYCQKGFYRKDHMKKHALVHEKPKPPLKPKPKKQLPDLYPIDMLPRKDVKPEITIHAPSSTRLRMPLSIKVPYKMVMSMDNGEQRAVTVDPHADRERYARVAAE